MNLSKRFQEKYISILHFKKRKRLSKKAKQIFVDKQQQESFNIVSTDESFFFYDTLL